MGVIILISFIVSFGIIAFGGLTRKRLAPLLFLFPLSLFVSFCILGYIALDWGSMISRTPWIPSLGINLDFKLDGLSLLFTLLITGIGSLVFYYAAGYLKGHKYLDRFFFYLSLFMTAMLGLVLSDNILCLFIFWELTSISSFFLIGFNNDEEASRKSSLLALAITGGGGFFLMAGFILMGTVGETYSIAQLLSASAVIQQSNAYVAIVVLIFLGAFTKSAQFPFHFWLPGAMKAPTPVSAYLHSATMVKAGIYLLARLSPILGSTIIWNTSLQFIGAITMVYAAIHIFFKTDLKGILAYSTIAALGQMVFLLGIGTEPAYIAFVVFVLAHAMYKAPLFLVTGIIDHAVHSRDITIIRGLRAVMPIVALAGLLAACSNAGIPLTLGFIGKDLVYESTLHSSYPYILTGIALFTNIMMLYAGWLAGVRPFIGKLPDTFTKIKLPYKSLWIPPLIIAICGIIFGIAPQLINYLLVDNAVDDLMPNTAVQLKLWHGFNLVLLLSVVTIAAGIGLFYLVKPSHVTENFIQKYEQISPKGLVEQFAELVRKFSYVYTRLLHNGYLRIYLIVIITFFTGLIGYRLFTEVPIQVKTAELADFKLYELVVVAIMVVAIGVVVRTSSRLTAIVSMSVVGYSICLIFVFYGAPDLAMTQFAIDTLTVVLFMLVMYRLPNFLSFSNWRIQARDAIISIAFGTVISLIALQALVTPRTREISDFYAQHAYTLAKGKNVVNVILVDFRGFDTMIETIVLSIAAIGVFAMLKLYNTTKD